ncbi:MAG: hypothetical protein GC154_12450 [bacterium]|nr:hypothetical protein [bacterium]
MTRTLLIVAHGSRSRAWNDAIAAFAGDVRAANAEEREFDAIAHAFMEFGSPSIPEAIETECERCEELVVQPLFLSISQHVTEDIPAEVEKAAERVGGSGGVALFVRKNARVILLPPPPAAPLLADNAAWRLGPRFTPADGFGVVLVLYGSSQYGEAWDELARETLARLALTYPDAPMTWVYAGDVAGFSPDPVARAIDDMAHRAERVAVVPGLVARGVIQTEVIAAAVERAHARERVVNLDDAILPDPALARAFLDAAEKRA